MLVAPRAASAGRSRPGSPQTSSTAAQSTTSRKRSPPPGPQRMRTEAREARQSALGDRLPARSRATGPARPSTVRSAPSRRWPLARRDDARGVGVLSHDDVPPPRRVRALRGAMHPPDFDAYCASLNPPAKTCRSTGATPASATTSSRTRASRSRTPRPSSSSPPRSRSGRAPTCADGRATGASASTCDDFGPVVCDKVQYSSDQGNQHVIIFYDGDTRPTRGPTTTRPTRWA